MESLNNNELLNINGGISKFVLGGIAIGVIFVASIIYGYVNPNKCNNTK